MGTVRLDILNNLPRGGAAIIAEHLGCSRPTVSRVLNGYKKSAKEGKNEEDILQMGEVMAALNIWNCRFKTHGERLNVARLAKGALKQTGRSPGDRIAELEEDMERVKNILKLI